MNSAIEDTARDILAQLSSTIARFTPSEYSQELNVLSGNSIGKHLRHVIDFFDCLVRGYESKIINYDARIRNEQLENDPKFASEMLNRIGLLLQLNEDCPLLLQGKYNDSEFTTKTTFERELVYNIEHAIHHMAIMKIAVRNHFPEIQLPANFGVAHSTISHQEQCAQ